MSNTLAAGEFTRRATACYESPRRDTTEASVRLIEALNDLGLSLSVQEAIELCEAEEALSGHGADGAESSMVAIGSSDDRAECSICMEPDVGRWLTSAEFCVVAAELYCQTHLPAVPPPLPSPRPPISSSIRIPTDGRVGESHPVCEVFLGGSCNPTVWRKQIAIPLLEQHHITYHNPQVEEWKPEMIEIEERAKEEASMLFYVVDNQTRAVSSMVELGYYAGKGRRVVVVVNDITGDRPQVAGEELHTREIEDLNRGRAFVRNLLIHNAAVLEQSVEKGVERVVELFTDQSHSTSAHQFLRTPICTCTCSNHDVRSVLRVLYQVFTMCDTDGKGSLNEREVRLALILLNIPQNAHVLAAMNGLYPITSSSSLNPHAVTKEDLFTLYAELRVSSCPSYPYSFSSSSSTSSTNLTHWLWDVLVTPFHWISGWMSYFYSPPPPSPPPPPPLLPSPVHDYEMPLYDVFLGGSCGQTRWRTDITIPILRKHNKTYFNPQMQDWNTCFIPVERQAKETCAVLLFNISGETLSVASMAEVSYYLGRQRVVVLCLNNLPVEEHRLIEGMKLSPRAVRDYNRGRAYLKSFCKNSSIPVFHDITEATLACVDMLNNHST